MRPDVLLPPDYDPSRWHLLPDAGCGGRRQSPVNIDTQEAAVDERLDVFRYTAFDDKHAIDYIINTGHSGGVGGGQCNSSSTVGGFRLYRPVVVCQ